MRAWIVCGCGRTEEVWIVEFVEDEESGRFGWCTIARGGGGPKWSSRAPIREPAKTRRDRLPTRWAPAAVALCSADWVEKSACVSSGWALSQSISESTVLFALSPFVRVTPSSSFMGPSARLAVKARFETTLSPDQLQTSVNCLPVDFHQPCWPSALSSSCSGTESLRQMHSRQNVEAKGRRSAANLADHAPRTM